MYFNFNGNQPLHNYWREVFANEKPLSNVDNRYYLFVWREQKEDDWYSTLFIHNSDKARTIDKLLAITKAEEFLDLFAGGRGGGMEEFEVETMELILKQFIVEIMTVNQINHLLTQKQEKLQIEI
ncbi:MAG: hypothetical protein CXB60_02250 [Spiroplasma poulsonii]|nr:hypothetical protein [Spiroplasma poulsonii]